MKRALNSLIAMGIAMALQTAPSQSLAQDVDPRIGHDVQKVQYEDARPILVALNLNVTETLRGGDYGV